MQENGPPDEQFVDNRSADATIYPHLGTVLCVVNSFNHHAERLGKVGSPALQ